MPARPVVCLHGLGRAPSDWDAVRDGLGRNGEVLAPALPRDPVPALEVVRATLTPDAVIVGHSLGGILALRAATLGPVRPAAIVLTGCPFPFARNGRTTRAAATDYAGHRIAFVRSLRDRPPAASSRRGTRAAMALAVRLLAQQQRFDAELAAPGVPVLAVHARDDHHVPYDFAIAAVGRHPGWELALLASGGHHAHLRAPEAWLDAVSPWLEARRAAG